MKLHLYYSIDCKVIHASSFSVVMEDTDALSDDDSFIDDSIYKDADARANEQRELLLAQYPVRDSLQDALVIGERCVVIFINNAEILRRIPVKVMLERTVIEVFMPQLQGSTIIMDKRNSAGCADGCEGDSSRLNFIASLAAEMLIQQDRLAKAVAMFLDLRPDYARIVGVCALLEQDAVMRLFQELLDPACETQPDGMRLDTAEHVRDWLLMMHVSNRQMFPDGVLRIEDFHPISARVLSVLAQSDLHVYIVDFRDSHLRDDQLNRLGPLTRKAQSILLSGNRRLEEPDFATLFGPSLVVLDLSRTCMKMPAFASLGKALPSSLTVLMLNDVETSEDQLKGFLVNAVPESNILVIELHRRHKRYNDSLLAGIRRHPDRPQITICLYPDNTDVT